MRCLSRSLGREGRGRPARKLSRSQQSRTQRPEPPLWSKTAEASGAIVRFWAKQLLSKAPCILQPAALSAAVRVVVVVVGRRAA